MSSYNALAVWYDRLTKDVSYPEFASFYESIFADSKEDVRLVLDLCCGTGSVTYELSNHGYDLISCDSSPEMLSIAQSKCSMLVHQPLFICQDAAELDLFGTVDAAVCALDSINYIPSAKLPELFRRLSLFIRPGGLFIFDMKSVELLRSSDGQISIDEDDSVFCVWRADWSEKDSFLLYGMDLFEKKNSLWSRSKEEHIEYAYDPEFIESLLGKFGFEMLKPIQETSFGGKGRIFFIARRHLL